MVLNNLGSLIWFDMTLRQPNIFTAQPPVNFVSEDILTHLYHFS